MTNSNNEKIRTIEILGISKSLFISDFEKREKVDGYNMIVTFNKNCKYSDKYYFSVDKKGKFGMPEEFKNTNIETEILEKISIYNYDNKI